MRSSSFLAALLVCAAIAVGSPARGEEPLKIRVAWTTVSGNLPVLFEKKEILKHYGTSYTVEHIHFAGSGLMVTALATGEIDLSPFSASSFGAAIQNAHLDDVRVILDGYQDGVPPYYSSKFLVRADSPIREVEDLKGKVLGVNSIGGASDIALRVMMRRHHLEDRRDYSIVEVQFPNMAAMLDQAKVALVASVSPYSQDIERRGIGRTLFDQGEALGGPSQSLFHGMRAGFVAQHHEAVQDFVEDYVRALRWFLAPENRGEAVRMMSDYAHEPPAMFATVLTHDDFYRDPGGRPNLDNLQANMRTLKEFGFLNTDIDVKRHADLSLIEEAAKRIR